MPIKRLLRIRPLATALALVCWTLACHADAITGRVVGVADGDTVTVLDADKVQHKIRLAGIDAPEKARAKRVGLWRDPEPVPPWEFRHRGK